MMNKDVYITISIVVFNWKDCYNVERDLLAAAKFLVNPLES